ncbi:hypothetical protein ACJJTC_016081 [Scirpophaga incertulas]
MSNRPTTIQLEALVEFLEQHPAIARGFLRTALGKQESKRKWAEIAMSLNSLGGVIKDGPAWAKHSVAVAKAEIPSTSLGDIEHIHSPLLPQTHEEHNEIQAEAPAAVPPPSKRLRRTRSSNYNTEIERMASIEERRVEAERLSAQAFADIGQKLDRIADANNNIAVAITAVANALQQIANKMAP